MERRLYYPRARAAMACACRPAVRHLIFPAMRLDKVPAVASLRHALWELRFRARVRFGRGALPNALVIGASKGGTTSVYRWRSRHPAVCVARIKEVRYFNSHIGQGPAWYAAQFAPKAGQTVLIEASPSYLWDPQVPGRVRSLLGEPKLVA